MLIAIIVVNVLAFIMFAIDKYKAQHKKYRIAEKVLLTWLLVGSVGGYFAMLICRHKTRKWYFHVVAVMGLLIWSYIVTVMKMSI